jgi:hypothetical protein
MWLWYKETEYLLVSFTLTGQLLPQRYRQRTPAMAAGRTHRRWSTDLCKEDDSPCIHLASKSLCCQKAPFCLPDDGFLSDRARGICPLCLSIESRASAHGKSGRGNGPFGQPMFLLVSTPVASMLSLSCKTGPFSVQMSEVARTTTHVANTTGRCIT